MIAALKLGAITVRRKAQGGRSTFYREVCQR